MKIVYCNIPMKDNLENEKQNYQVKGNSSINYDGSVIFPINMVLASKLKHNDDVKVILLAKQDPNDNVKRNILLFKNELNNINDSIGANISYEVINITFDEWNAKVHDETLMKIVKTLNNNAEIYCDITFGPKSLPIIMLTALKFANKFFDCEIKDIVYGQVNFINDKPVNPILCNLRSLYYLNNITDMVSCNSSEEAIKILSLMLNL